MYLFQDPIVKQIPSFGGGTHKGQEGKMDGALEEASDVLPPQLIQWSSTIHSLIRATNI